MKAERRSSLPFYLKLNTETARVTREGLERVETEGNSQGKRGVQSSKMQGPNLKSLVAMRDLMKSTKLSDTIEKSSRPKRTSASSIENSKYLNSSARNQAKTSPQEVKQISSFRSSSSKKTAEEHVQEVFDDYIQKTEFQNKYKRIKVETIKVQSVEDFRQYIEDRFQVECGQWSVLELMTFLVQNYFLLEVNKLNIEEQVSYLCQKLVNIEDSNAELESALSNYRNQTSQLNFELGAFYNKAQEEKAFYERLQRSHKTLSEKLNKVIELFGTNYSMLEQGPVIRECLSRLETIVGRRLKDPERRGDSSLEHSYDVFERSEAMEQGTQTDNADLEFLLRKYKLELEALENRLRSQTKESESLREELEHMRSRFDKRTLEDISERKTTLESEVFLLDKRLLTEEAKDTGGFKEKNNRFLILIQKELATIKESMEVYKNAVLTKIKSDGNCFESEGDYKELLSTLKRIRDEKLSSELSVLFVRILEKFKVNYKKLSDDFAVLNEKYHSREDQQRIIMEEVPRQHHHTILPFQIISTTGIQPGPFIPWRGLSPVRPGIIFPKKI